MTACEVATNNERVVVAFRVRHRCDIAPQSPQVNPAQTINVTNVFLQEAGLHSEHLCTFNISINKYTQ